MCLKKVIRLQLEQKLRSPETDSFWKTLNFVFSPVPLLFVWSARVKTSKQDKAGNDLPRSNARWTQFAMERYGSESIPCRWQFLVAHAWNLGIISKSSASFIVHSHYAVKYMACLWLYPKDISSYSSLLHLLRPTRIYALSISFPFVTWVHLLGHALNISPAKKSFLSSSPKQDPMALWP